MTRSNSLHKRQAEALERIADALEDIIANGVPIYFTPPGPQDEPEEDESPAP